MSDDRIRRSMEGLGRHFAENPEKARRTDPPAVAVVESGLRCRADGPKGAVLVTDMPEAIGGDGSMPTPGWFLRAALATCDATMIKMRASQLGIELATLEVTVDSDSDARGLLDEGGAECAGPLAVRIRVRIAADGVSADRLREIVDWAERHSPVGDSLRRSVPTTMEIETV